ncbi:MAG: prepilin peptidase [Aquificota bacterium]|nr:MAG: prepilin peptidase [Aquificota bacterium]
MTDLQALKYAFLFVLGAVFGSFYNVLIYRLPRGMSIVSPPSHCPFCKTPIRWYHNIPIVSYLLLRGKCATCSARVPLRYPLVELASAFLLVFCFVRWDEPLTALVYYAFFSALLVASLIDWDTFILPDSITLGGLAFGLALSFFRKDITPYESLVGAFVGGGLFLLIYLFYTKVRGIEGLGFGDVKLMAFIGSVTGLWGVLYAVFVGSLLGLLYALPIILKNKSLQFALPYGPFLSLGCFVGVVFELKRFFT